jgi:hypothetical protein
VVSAVVVIIIILRMQLTGQAAYMGEEEYILGSVGKARRKEKIRMAYILVAVKY